MSYEALVAAALLGTARRPPDVAPPPGAPDDLAAALAGRPPEEGLLAAAAAWSIARRAGAVPGPSSPPEAAPPDDRPLCPPRSGQRLAAMLDGIHSGLVPEWLELVAAAGMRPPPELLPELLELAEERPELRAAATAAAGPRAEWLAAHGAFAPAEDVWERGSRPARSELLARLRRADPAAGRALLASTWEAETADDRAAFLEELVHGLGPDDEPFLEAALGDRRKPVRRAAADLLWSLPGSRLAARMAERSVPLVEAGALPEACDKEMERDGVERTPPRGVGARQFWLAQLVEATPLTAWPLELAGRKGEWRELLRGAWARAALRQRNVEWARALLGETAELLAVLPKAERERAAARLEEALICPGPWGLELSRRVLEWLRADDARDVAEVALRLHPDTLADVEPLRERGLRRVCDLADFRAGMLRDLR